jgi:hypothetical protein
MRGRRPPMSGRVRPDPPGWQAYCDQRDQWYKEDLEYWFRRFSQIDDKREAFNFIKENRWRIFNPCPPDFGTDRGEWKTANWGHSK